MNLDKEAQEQEVSKLQDEEDKYIEEAFANYREGELPDDELKELETREARLNYIIKQYKEREDWKKALFDIKEYKVLKMPRVMQSLLYLMKYEREQVCEKDSNKFFWKIAKQYVNDEFLNKLDAYKCVGPKSDQYKKYQTLNFIERNLEGIQLEDVEGYN